MKDEEMAEEYIEKNCKIWEEGELTVDEIVRLAFLAGLKAGRPHWHNLRENPNDFPERMGIGSKEVYVSYEDGVTDFASYRFDKKYWERSANEALAQGVIAWCELPTFDKE